MKPSKYHLILAATGLLALLLATYSNSFDADWQYDDHVNIVDNPNVQPESCEWKHLKKSLRSLFPHQVISRPLAYLSFALNYCAGGLSVKGYHVVNLSIHSGAALFLFLLIRELLYLPVFESRYSRHAGWIAWLAAALWAAHPIQVTAVTYIVQRMTSMAGMFYVATLFFFVRGRSSQKRQAKLISYLLCAVCGGAALLSKENAVLLLPAVVLLDLMFFPKEGGSGRRRLILYFLAILAAGAVCLLYLDPLKLFAPYHGRNFTMLERLMTQPRVILMYLAFLTVPMNSRMAIIHDVSISRSLLDPWTTLPAFVGVVAMLTFLIWMIPRQRLFAFCGLFYFLNHLVESSFLNLELMYEHRNYIPSMLLFVPVAVAAVRSVIFFSYRKTFQTAMVAVTGLLLVSNAFATWSYNAVFKDEPALWAHVVKRYPTLSTARNNLAKAFHVLGAYDYALEEHLKALEFDRYNNTYQKAVTLFNLGNHELHQNMDYDRARDYFTQALRIYPKYQKAFHELARTLLLFEHYEAATRTISSGLETWPADEILLRFSAYAALKQNKCEEAMASMAGISSSSRYDGLNAMYRAQSYRCKGDYDRALEEWRRIDTKGDAALARLSALAILELNIESGDEDSIHADCRMIGANRQPFHIIFKRDKNALMPYVPDTDMLNRILPRICEPFLNPDRPE
jgi:protein O-mannosyl-transferase